MREYLLEVDTIGQVSVPQCVDLCASGDDQCRTRLPRLIFNTFNHGAGFRWSGCRLYPGFTIQQVDGIVGQGTVSADDFGQVNRAKSAGAGGIDGTCGQSAVFSTSYFFLQAVANTPAARAINKTCFFIKVF